MLLCAAVEFGHYDLVVSLLQSGFDVNACQVKPCPMPLHIACAKREKNFKVIQTLLDYGADVHLKGDTQMEGGPIESALSIAVKQDDDGLLELLMGSCRRREPTSDSKTNVCIKKPEEQQDTHPILLAATHGSLNCLKYLLNKNIIQAKIDDKNGKNCTICSKCNLIDQEEPVSNKTCLMLGIHNLKVTNELIKHGADVNTRNSFGQTALWLLMNSYNEFNPRTMNTDICDRVKLLLEAKASIFEQHFGRCLLSALYSNVSRGIVYACTQFDTEQWSQVFTTITKLILYHNSNDSENNDKQSHVCQLLSTETDCTDDMTTCRNHVQCLSTLIDELRNTVLYFPRKEASNYPADGLGSIEVIFKLVENLFRQVLNSQMKSFIPEDNELIDRLTLVMYVNDRYNISDNLDRDWTAVLQSMSNIILDLIRAGYSMQTTESLSNLFEYASYPKYDDMLEDLFSVLPHDQYSQVHKCILQNTRLSFPLLCTPRTLMQQSACTIRRYLKPPKRLNCQQLGLPILLQNYI